MDYKKLDKALEKFRKEVDEVFIGKTPKITGFMDTAYEVDIYIWRHKGMGNSKQLISGNPVSVCTATASYLETLLREGIVDESQLLQITNLAIKSYKGQL